MWRIQSTHKQSETEFLDQVVKRVEADEQLRSHVRAIIQGAASAEPLMAEALRTPQDVRYHAEGPFLSDHLELMLMFLHAVVQEKVHLIDIEELRRLKGYEGEIDELEEVLKEHIGFFEVFTLCHDIAKWPSIFFTSVQGSRGAQEGFHMDREHLFAHKHDARAQMREQYLQLFEQYQKEHPNQSSQEQQATFFLHYEIEVHYPHHARKIFAPVYESLLERFCIAHRLAPGHVDLVKDLIAGHMSVIRDFQDVRPARIGTYLHQARARGWDGDDYIDLMQGALLLDAVFGSKRLSPHGYWHDPAPIVNCLKSEHDWAPHRRVERHKEREAQEKRRRNTFFKDVGLDGVALMELLGMDPGKEFGMTLRRIHAGVLGRGAMPKFGKKIDQQIETRATAYYNKAFRKGE